jgi:hypothetical protein
MMPGRFEAWQIDGDLQGRGAVGRGSKETNGREAVIG